MEMNIAGVRCWQVRIQLIGLVLSAFGRIEETREGKEYHLWGWGRYEGSEI